MLQRWMAESVRKIMGGSSKLDSFTIVEIRLQGVLSRYSQKPRFEMYKDMPGQKMVRVYAYDTGFFTTSDGKEGLEVRIPASPDMIFKSEEAVRTGEKFKFYTPKKGIHVYTEKSIAERIRAYIRRTGSKNELHPIDGYARPYGFDIVNGIAIIKVVFV